MAKVITVKKVRGTNAEAYGEKEIVKISGKGDQGKKESVKTSEELIKKEPVKISED